MGRNRAAYRGCLLGMAVGDAMGYTVDSMRLAEIRQNYGPNGLRGYDLVNGYADVTSNTQLAAFTCNGLLIALTRGQMTGRMAPFVKYIALSDKEWMFSQRRWDSPEHSFCWLQQEKELCRRNCMDTRMLETINRGNFGTLDDPKNNFITPGSLTTAIGVGLFDNKDRMGQEELDLLGAEAVALTHGGSLAFLSGAALAHMISTCLKNPEIPFPELVQDTIDALLSQFAHNYTRTYELIQMLKLAVDLAANSALEDADVMDQLHCENSAQVLAGAVYACIAGKEDFDSSLIIAVNHSGRSSTVGAVVGALLGLRQKEEALPEFYIECLEPAEILMELADDLFYGCPMEMGSKLFDEDWDRKYVHGGK